MAPQQKFTEKHKRALDIMLKSVDLPEFVTLEIVEEVPNNLEFVFHLDSIKALKSPERAQKDINYELIDGIENYITQIMGYKEGNPTHGDVSISSSVVISDLTPWIKTEWDKVIKPKIKSLESVKTHVRSIRTSTKKYGYIFEVQLIFSGYINYDVKLDVIYEVKNLVTELGYNTENLKVTR